MKLAFLVNGKDAMDLLAGTPFRIFETLHRSLWKERRLCRNGLPDRKTVKSTKMLADYRDQLLALEKNKMSKKRSVKCLHDEASEFFCARLYP